MDLKIPAAWTELLTKVQAVSPQAIIAGGCLRDLYHDKPIADIDLFVPAWYINLVGDMIQEERNTLSKTIHEAYFTFNPDVREVRYYEGDGMIPVNIVGVEGECTLDVQLDRFDFDICRIGYDGKELRVSDAFLQDSSDYTFTLRGDQTPDQQRHSLQRFLRIGEKYQGYKLVIEQLEGAVFF